MLRIALVLLVSVFGLGACASAPKESTDDFLFIARADLVYDQCVGKGKHRLAVPGEKSGNKGLFYLESKGWKRLRPSECKALDIFIFRHAPEMSISGYGGDLKFEVVSFFRQKEGQFFHEYWEESLRIALEIEERQR